MDKHWTWTNSGQSLDSINCDPGPRASWHRSLQKSFCTIFNLRQKVTDSKLCPDFVYVQCWSRVCPKGRQWAMGGPWMGHGPWVGHGWAMGEQWATGEQKLNQIYKLSQKVTDFKFCPDFVYVKCWSRVCPMGRQLAMYGPWAGHGSQLKLVLLAGNWPWNPNFVHFLSMSNLCPLSRICLVFVQAWNTVIYKYTY